MFVRGAFFGRHIGCGAPEYQIGSLLLVGSLLLRCCRERIGVCVPSGRVHQIDGQIVAVDRCGQIVPCRARDVGYDGVWASRERVVERAFSRVGQAQNHDTPAPRRPSAPRRVAQEFPECVASAADPLYDFTTSEEFDVFGDEIKTGFQVAQQIGLIPLQFLDAG